MVDPEVDGADPRGRWHSDRLEVGRPLVEGGVDAVRGRLVVLADRAGEPVRRNPEVQRQLLGRGGG